LHEYGRREFAFGFRFGKFENFEGIFPIWRILLNDISKEIGWKLWNELICISRGKSGRLLCPV
jgi:hypothetical protein